MSALSAMAAIPGEGPKAPQRTIAGGFRPYPSWKQAFRPRTAGLCGLAIAVGLWGFSYKLSLYRHPTPAQQATIAKLWFAPPDALLAEAQKLKNQSHLIASPQALSTSISRLPGLDYAVSCIFPVNRRGVLAFDSPSPLRSPPPQGFRAA